MTTATSSSVVRLSKSICTPRLRNAGTSTRTHPLSVRTTTESLLRSGPPLGLSVRRSVVSVRVLRKVRGPSLVALGPDKNVKGHKVTPMSVSTTSSVVSCSCLCRLK